MSETISQLPAGTASVFGDVIPVTQGSTGSGTGTTRKLTVAKILEATEVFYAGDPAFAGGVLANNTADDTNAWAAAFAAAAPTGAVVVAPIGISKVSQITIPSNVILIGRNVEAYGGSSPGQQSYTAGTGSALLGSIISANSSSTPVIMSAFSQLRDIAVVGTSVQVVINASAGRVLLDNVNITGGTSGVNFSTNTTAGGSIIRNCQIHNINGNGIDNPVNCLIIDNIINGNTSNGISLTNICNGNLINGNRIEWNYLAGISVVGSSGSVADRNTIVGNWIDRSGTNGLVMNFASHTTVSGNTINRSGRNQSGAAGTQLDATFNLSNCFAVTVIGNATSVWNDDANTGYISPYWAVWDGGGNGALSPGSSAVNLIIGNTLGWHGNSTSQPSTGPINVTTTFNLPSGLNSTFWEAG